MGRPTDLSRNFAHQGSPRFDETCSTFTFLTLRALPCANPGPIPMLGPENSEPRGVLGRPSQQ